MAKMSQSASATASTATDCTIFTPPHPKIRPELSEILEAEAGMPGLAELEAEAAEATERIRLRITDDVEFEG